jgi:GT2 family glycosyltransferase
MLHQCAHFSRHGLPGVELIYVLDDPPRKNDLINLAQRCFRWFGIPMRLVLLPQNVGYGPANNEALRVAHGRYVCFLNSDVLPRDGEWLRRMVGALEADGDLGAVGARLLFEDGTVQHDGMSLRRLPQFGNIPFPLHPGKGQRPPPGRGLRQVEAITGACMVLPRALAQATAVFLRASGVASALLARLAELLLRLDELSLHEPQLRLGHRPPDGVPLERRLGSLEPTTIGLSLGATP